MAVFQIFLSLYCSSAGLWASPLIAMLSPIQLFSPLFFAFWIAFGLTYWQLHKTSNFFFMNSSDGSIYDKKRIILSGYITGSIFAFIGLMLARFFLCKYA